MHNTDHVILGINHQFLYPEAMVNGDIHTATLEELSQTPYVDALDCWVWAAHAKEEIRILRESGKVINYNIGDRFGETPVFPASGDKKDKTYAMDILHRESDFALELGAKKIIFGSGKAVPGDMEGSLNRYIDFLLEWDEYLPEDVCLCLEPTDWDIDKFFMLGRLEDTVRCVEAVKQQGGNMGILLDMGHIPIMHETLESAVRKTAPYLQHIHLGNCVIRDPQHPLYGDKHPCWGYDGGEYDEHDGASFLRILHQAGYLSRGKDQTVTFEMRTLTGMTAQETTESLSGWFRRTRNQI